MSFILLWTAGLAAASLVLALLWRLVLFFLRRRPRRRFRTVLLIILATLPLHAALTVPIILGWFGARIIGTRGDEKAYEGPRLDAAGEWLVQSTATLKDDAAGTSPLPESMRAAARARAVALEASDGVPLRAFFVPAREQPPRFAVVLVHGLFRGGLEIEAPGRMFRALGGDVMLLEMRNHGGSGRAHPTFGRDESRDVIAAARWLRARPGGTDRKLVLFGVSLGSAAVALAAPEVDHLAGIVLDAPADELLGAGHRMLGRDPRPGQRGLALPQPCRSVAIASLEFWTHSRLADVRPIDAMRKLAPSVAALIIGGSLDERMPPDVVRAVFDAIPAPPARKELWIRDGSDHGKVWSDDPEGYLQHLRAFIERL